MSAGKLMRAIRVSEFGGPSVLKLCSDVAVPEPGHRQVRPTGGQTRQLSPCPLWLDTTAGLMAPKCSDFFFFFFCFVEFCYRGFKRSLTFTKPQRPNPHFKPNPSLDKWKCASLHPIIVKIDRTLGTISIVWVFLLRLCLFFALQRSSSSRHVFYIPESYTVVLQENSFEHRPLILRRKLKVVHCASAFPGGSGGQVLIITAVILGLCWQHWTQSVSFSPLRHRQQKCEQVNKQQEEISY